MTGTTPPVFNEAALRNAVKLDLDVIDCVADAFTALSAGKAIMPPILRLEVDDFLYVRKGYKTRVHPKKDLLSVLTDEEGFLLVTENGHEARSGVSLYFDDSAPMASKSTVSVQWSSSAPPAITTSCLPIWMSSAPLPMQCAEVEQAEEIE